MSGRQIGWPLLSCGSAMACNMLAGGYAVAGSRHQWPRVGPAEWATRLWAPQSVTYDRSSTSCARAALDELGPVAATRRHAQRTGEHFRLHAGPGETTVTVTLPLEQS